MIIPKSELLEITDKFKLNREEQFNNILTYVGDLLIKSANEGKYGCSINIIYVTNKFMSPDITCDYIYTKLSDTLKSLGYVCHKYEDYNEYSLRIQW